MYESMLADCGSIEQPLSVHGRGLTLALTQARTCAASATGPRRATCTTGFMLLAPKASAIAEFARSCAAHTAAVRSRVNPGSMQLRFDQSVNGSEGMGIDTGWCKESCQGSGAGSEV